jgi:hypothetical protein
MFWRGKYQCKHEWHYLKEDYIYSNAGASVDVEDACWILCVRCEKEKLIHKEEWQRIRRRQDVLRECKS